MITNEDKNKITKIPENIKCHTLDINGYNEITKIPENIRCHTLNIKGDNKINPNWY